MVITLCLCIVYGSQNRQQLLPYAALTGWFCVTEGRMVAARYAPSPYKQVTFRLETVKCLL